MLLTVLRFHKHLFRPPQTDSELRFYKFFLLKSVPIVAKYGKTKINRDLAYAPLPALGAGYVFSRVWNRLHAFPRF